MPGYPVAHHPRDHNGMLMSTLAVPVVLMSTPKAKIKMRKMNSPPATPSRLLIVPTTSPAPTAAGARQLLS
jgi:hypothetical protein